MDENFRGYVIRGVDDEYLMVIRGYDPDLIFATIQRIKASREPAIKNLGIYLEELYFDSYDGRDSGGGGPKVKKETTGRLVNRDY